VNAGNHLITGNGTSSSNATYDFLLLSTNDNRTITIADGASLDIQGRFDTPNASLAKNGNGTLILSGQNGSGGAFQIDGADAFSVNAGVLRFANTNAAGNSRNNYSVASGAAIEIFGGFSQTSSNGTITLNGTGIGSTGALRSISGNNTITAGAASPGTIVLSAASSIGVDADTFTIGKGISGSNSLTKVGAGTLVLGRAAAINNNTYSGATLVDGGTLQFAITGALYGGNSTNWTAANINAKAGTTLAFNVGGTSEFTTGNVTTLLGNLAASSSTTNGMNAGSALGFDTTNAGGSFTIANVIADTTGSSGGARGLTKLGTGSLVLSNTNTYTGPARSR
jgi:autotransporter-associated beta strand protein